MRATRLNEVPEARQLTRLRKGLSRGNNHVPSKLGTGHVFAHELFEVPASYGTKGRRADRISAQALRCAQGEPFVAQGKLKPVPLNPTDKNGARGTRCRSLRGE